MTNSQQEQLVQLETKAEKKQRRCIDFITRLPVEILPDIFSAFSSENLAMCTLVSPAWYKRIVQCTSLWELLELRQKNELVWLLLPDVAPHVKNLVYTRSISRTTKINQDINQITSSKESKYIIGDEKSVTNTDYCLFTIHQLMLTCRVYI